VILRYINKIIIIIIIIIITITSNNISKYHLNKFSFFNIVFPFRFQDWKMKEIPWHKMLKN
jgi:hypothetical protein